MRRKPTLGSTLEPKWFRVVKRKLMGMTTTDYVISASLILLVIPQIRGVRLTVIRVRSSRVAAAG
ncbi:hypothetical protein [Streptomyces mirabilis]|uniref:hypothetical protein n=1 Tax=Streptomyces mirabilis TaxID=68239 RepID=UPI0036E40984